MPAYAANRAVDPPQSQQISVPRTLLTGLHIVVARLSHKDERRSTRQRRLRRSGTSLAIAVSKRRHSHVADTDQVPKRGRQAEFRGHTDDETDPADDLGVLLNKYKHYQIAIAHRKYVAKT